MNRRVVRAHVKARKFKRDKHMCEHCMWEPPVSSMLHAHHVVPLACGGLDAPENLIVLCPNCHALAHYVAPRYNSTRLHRGPSSALELRRWMAATPRELKVLQADRLFKDIVPILAEMRA